MALPLIVGISGVSGAVYGVRPAELLERYTVPAVHEASDMPVVKLKMGGDDGKGPCSFMVPEGCSVYADRPLTCRYYPLGLVSHKLKDSDKKEDFHFLVKESHCKGHLEAKTQTVEEFRREQGVADYEGINRGWVDVLMKLASWKSIGGPMGKAPSRRPGRCFSWFRPTLTASRIRSWMSVCRLSCVHRRSPNTLRAVLPGNQARP